MKNVRIKRAPKTRGDQDNYSLVKNIGAVYDFPVESNHANETITSLKGEDLKKAKIEVEGGESVIGDVNKDGHIDLFHFKGKRHSEGGMPVNIPEGSFIYSDTKDIKIKDEDVLKKFFGLKPKTGGYTPGEISKKYSINKYVEILKNKDSDDISKRTANEMIKRHTEKLGILALLQEAIKGFPDGMPSIAQKALESLGENPEQLIQSVMPQQEMTSQEGMMRQGGELSKFQKGGSDDMNRRAEELRARGFKVTVGDNGRVHYTAPDNKTGMFNISDTNKYNTLLQTYKPKSQNAPAASAPKLFYRKDNPNVVYRIVDKGGKKQIYKRDLSKGQQGVFELVKDPSEAKKVISGFVDKSTELYKFQNLTPNVAKNSEKMPGFGTRGKMNEFKNSGEKEKFAVEAYEKALKSDNPQLMIETAKALNKIDVSGWGQIPGTNQNKLLDMSHILEEQALKILNKHDFDKISDFHKNAPSYINDLIQYNQSIIETLKIGDPKIIKLIEENEKLKLYNSKIKSHQKLSKEEIKDLSQKHDNTFQRGLSNSYSEFYGNLNYVSGDYIEAEVLSPFSTLRTGFKKGHNDLYEKAKKFMQKSSGDFLEVVINEESNNGEEVYDDERGFFVPVSENNKSISEPIVKPTSTTPVSNTKPVTSKPKVKTTSNTNSQPEFYGFDYERGGTYISPFKFGNKTIDLKSYELAGFVNNENPEEPVETENHPQYGKFIKKEANGVSVYKKDNVIYNVNPDGKLLAEYDQTTRVMTNYDYQKGTITTFMRTPDNQLQVQSRQRMQDWEGKHTNSAKAFEELIENNPDLQKAIVTEFKNILDNPKSFSSKNKPTPEELQRLRNLSELQIIDYLIKGNNANLTLASIYDGQEDILRGDNWDKGSSPNTRYNEIFSELGLDPMDKFGIMAFQASYIASQKVAQSPDYIKKFKNSGFDVTPQGKDDQQAGIGNSPISPIDGIYGNTTNGQIWRLRDDFKPEENNVNTNNNVNALQNQFLYYCVNGSVISVPKDQAPPAGAGQGYSNMADAEKICSVQEEDLNIPADPQKEGPWYLPDYTNFLTTSGQRIGDFAPSLRTAKGIGTGYDTLNPITRIASILSAKNQRDQLAATTLDPNLAMSLAYGDPQIGSDLAQNIGEIELQNVGIANQAYSQNAQIQNQAEMFNVGQLEKYDRDVATYGQQAINARNKKESMKTIMFNTGWNNWVNKKHREQVLTPQAYQDPITGNWSFSGKGRDITNPFDTGFSSSSSSSSSGEFDINALNNNAKRIYENSYNQVRPIMGEEEARRYAGNMASGYSRSAMNRAGKNGSNPSFGASYDPGFLDEDFE